MVKFDAGIEIALFLSRKVPGCPMESGVKKRRTSMAEVPTSDVVSNIRKAILSYKVHWHVILVHFPVSFFLGAAGFQILHLFWAPASFELASNVALLAGTIMLIPTTLSGWASWKKDYKGAKGKIFRIKIRVAFAMLFFSIALSIWRFGFISIQDEATLSYEHWPYFFGTLLLFAGAVVEGFYGGRLNHR
jgi:uncharacterized membrane protein